MIILRIIFWLGWVLCSWTLTLATTFLTARTTNTHVSPLYMVLFGIVVFILICGGLRWWIGRIRTPGLRLFPFFLGLFFNYTTYCFGIFVVPDRQITFQALTILLMALYFPAFLTEDQRDKLRPPSSPK